MKSQVFVSWFIMHLRHRFPWSRSIQNTFSSTWLEMLMRLSYLLRRIHFQHEVVASYWWMWSPHEDAARVSSHHIWYQMWYHFGWTAITRYASVPKGIDAASTSLTRTFLYSHVESIKAEMHNVHNQDDRQIKGPPEGSPECRNMLVLTWRRRWDSNPRRG